MNLIPDGYRSIYTSGLNDLHDTFAREILVFRETKTAITGLSDADDDYDFTLDSNRGAQEFSIGYIETGILARIKYIDRQDKEFNLATLEVEHLSLDFGLIRIKVQAADCQTVVDSSSITVDGFNANVVMRDRQHGLFSPDYCTFYLQRTP